MEMIQLWSLSSERLRKGDSKERAFNAMDDIRLSTIDVIASITFGTSFNSIRTAVEFLESEPHAPASKRPPTPILARSLEQLLITIGRNSLFPIPNLLTWWTRTFDTEWNRAHKHLHRFLGDKLDEARQVYESSGQSEKRPEARSADNVLDMILEKEKEGQLKGEAALNRSEILDELATYALGGSESKCTPCPWLADRSHFIDRSATATTVQWSVKILAHHPRSPTETSRGAHRKAAAARPAAHRHVRRALEHRPPPVPLRRRIRAPARLEHRVRRHTRRHVRHDAPWAPHPQGHVGLPDDRAHAAARVGVAQGRLGHPGRREERDQPEERAEVWVLGRRGLW